MQLRLRLNLLIAIGLFLVFVISFLPIFWKETLSALELLLSGRAFRRTDSFSDAKRYPKYFHEGQEGGVLRHYDGRFQHGILVDASRMDAQTHMIRAYLEFSKEHELETWLAHGTLLGWWWNARV